MEDKIEKLRGYLDVPSVEKEIKDLEKRLAQDDIWKDVDKANKLLKDKSVLEDKIRPFLDVVKRYEELNLLIELSEEEGGEVFADDIERELKMLKSELDALELRSVMTGPHDKSNAIVIIHPGAGGTESQDWAEMLMRMYMRWAERKGFVVKVVDLLLGDIAGIKSATLTVNGEYAYGYLKAESGIHRLVRISPFDANKRRHTSFTAVIVYPEIEEDIEIDIRPEDLRIDTYRASGAGGQHVNKTSSAVRITHIPTGIVVSCQNERSQHKNKAMAMKILRAKLYKIKKEEQEEKIERIKGEKKEIAWGNQIRSYILQPYQLVKDHRTGLEVGNVEAVLNGNIDEFIKAYLL
ncbi:MAG: peptide chain release factor 2, partial [Nitrospirae bacterium]